MADAAAIIIGDEVLAGKVQDLNTPRLITVLREAGVRLARIAIIGDDPEEIADEVRRCADLHGIVITSGGLGPTHDDCTVVGVARAFGLEVESSPELEALVRGWLGDRVNAAALRMALVPAGARLFWDEDRTFPLVAVRNVYLLPGVPEIFHRKLELLRGRLRGRPIAQGAVFLSTHESVVADLLAEVQSACPEVRIGSYPRRAPDHRVMVTVEGEITTTVVGVVRELRRRLPGDTVVRTEEPDEG